MLWSLMREGTGTLIAVPTSLILARLLSPQEFGTAAIAYFFLSLSSRLSHFGLNAALLRMRDLHAEHRSTAFIVNLGVGVGAWLLLALLAPSIGTYVRSEQAGQILPVAALTFPILAFGTVPGTLLALDMKYREVSTCEALATITNSAVSVVLAWSGFSFWSLVYGALASDLAKTSARLYFTGWRPSPKFSPRAFFEMWSFGAGIYVKNLLNYTAGNIDNLIIGRYLGTGALGMYDKGFRLVSKIVARINLSGPGATLRIFSLIHDEPERFRRGYRRVVMAVTMVGYPVFAGLIVLAPELFRVLFGEAWTGAVLPFQILCGAGMLRLLNAYASSATQAKGMIWSEVGRQAFVTILLAGSVALFCRWGVPGAAAGVLLATAATTVLMQRLTRRLTGFDWRDLLEPQVPAAVCSIGLVLAVGLSKIGFQTYAPNVATWIVLLVGIALSALYYLSFLLFSGFSEVRSLVFETLDDVAPPVARRVRALTAGKGLAPAIGQ
jgi:PST family polysaccharide transporter